MFDPAQMLEYSAIFFTAVCVLLAARNNIHTWWVGLIGCILYGKLFFDSQLYADALLQVFFMWTGVIGWMNWGKEEIKEVTRAPKKDLYKYAGLSLIVGSSYAAFLKYFTDAFAPTVDSFVMVSSVVGQFLLMRRQIETWPVWIAVNLVSIPLYFSRGLTMTGFLYIAFLINAIYGYYTWNKELKANAVQV